MGDSSRYPDYSPKNMTDDDLGFISFITSQLGRLGALKGATSIADSPLWKWPEPQNRLAINELRQIATKKGYPKVDFLFDANEDSFSPIEKRVRLTRDSPLGVAAHELGHSRSSHTGTVLRQGLSRLTLPASAMIPFMDENSDEAKFLTAAGTVSSMPRLAEEVVASVRGHRLLNELGKTRKLRIRDKASPYVGLGTYLVQALAPIAAYLVSGQLKGMNNKDETQ
jgi:hypothetical protein